MWQHLAALVVVPLLATGVVTTGSVLERSRELAEAGQAGSLMRAATELDTVRRAVESELLPTLTRNVTRDREQALTAGFGDQRAVTYLTAVNRLQLARQVTDRAVARIPGTSPAALRTALAVERLRTVRSAADQGTSSTDALAGLYLDLSDWLAHAEEEVITRTTATGLSDRSALAVNDVTLVAALTQQASRELPVTFTARVLEGSPRVRARQRSAHVLGTYRELAGTGSELSTSRMRLRWAEVTGSGSARRVAEVLAVETTSPGRLSGPELLGLEEASAQRDRDLAALLEDAVDTAVVAIDSEQAGAARRLRTTVLVSLLVLAGALAAALAEGRWLAGSLRRLADAARRVGRGELVDVPESGPREVRTAARALAGAVAGLRRVREQADALSRGDLAGALREHPVRGPLGEAVQASVQQLVRAVQQREELQGELAHQAAHDPLTGLPNRAAALRLLSRALDACAPGAATGLLFVDLDGFKAVNDTAGHAAGDAVLREVADRLRACVRDGDVVGRLGGDEFVVLVHDVVDETDLVRLGERVVASVRRPLEVGADRVTRTAGRAVRVGASVGVALAGAGSAGSAGPGGAEVLLAEADSAVYRAKSRGRGRVEVFDDVLREELTARSDLQSALREGLRRGELTLHYQPVVGLADGSLAGYEALARWDRPGAGPVRPDVFVAAAEASSLVCDLGRWVLHEATAQLARWRCERPVAWPAPGEGTEPTIAVNVSGRHLAEPRLLEDVADALAASGLPPHLLVLEITETVLVDDPGATARLQRLRATGVAVAIDDFGTGFTSIGQLPSTPADTLKIDRSFVASTDAGRRGLVALTVHAAHTFGLRVVAEGVEEPEQLRWLREQGCDTAQGYLLGRPLPAGEAAAWALPALGTAVV
ncbi:bifunctional diguanylate cyclase/phosphodiesterase [Kineococcus sp. TRM81007]|uniref:putative bifunctional diguanylate cyclase/phosphodiesterase n=1 Tax=Kineococcus sp. TRM81007 TaxID=2925831 RepID=UPI001F55E4BB|nr:bifunctional diguanylate cyclase/phosphodiesterase [Kineococcus sp. TRM81007]MCI2238155.1 bifunctional diguanylate cyclase/phosphodiesterase [Kineococcus sp. TRM81007]